MSSLIGGLIQRALQKGPDEYPEFPKEQPQAPLAAQPKAPENVPGEKDISQAATVKDEKRRILSVLPKATKTTYAGNNTAGSDSVIKKRVLGNSGTGQATTGV